MSKRQDDILVSVCFSDADDPDAARKGLMPLVAALQERYRYWEILIVNEAGTEAEFEETLIALPNLRYLSVVKGLDNSQRRVVAASEAIGDIVVLTSLQELASLDIVKMIDEAYSEGAVILGQRPATTLVEPLVVALGRASGFHASTRDMRTLAVPRTVLNRLLSDPNPILSLRFPPRDNSLIVLRRAAIPRAPRGRIQIFPRLELIMRLLTEAGPSFLGTIALTSAMVSVCALLFAIYVAIVYLTRADIAEGWTTLSLAISGMVGFLGVALFAICITLRKVAEIVRGGAVDYLVAERSSVDLFESVAHELNVDTDDGTERVIAPDARLPAQLDRAQS